MNKCRGGIMQMYRQNAVISKGVPGVVHVFPLSRLRNDHSDIGALVGSQEVESLIESETQYDEWFPQPKHIRADVNFTRYDALTNSGRALNNGCYGMTAPDEDKEFHALSDDFETDYALSLIYRL